MMVLAPRTDHNLTVAVMVEEEKLAAGGTALGIIRAVNALLCASDHLTIAVVATCVTVLVVFVVIIIVHNSYLLYFFFCNAD